LDVVTTSGPDTDLAPCADLAPRHRRRAVGLAAAAAEGWRDHVGGELRVVALDCRHSELMDADVLDRLGPILAAELATE
jgi:hypothetical protein